MRKICLIWVHCPQFQQYEYIVVFIKQICNLIMIESSKYLEPTALFQGELTENLPRIDEILEIFTNFKNHFEIIKTEYLHEKFSDLANKSPNLKIKPRFWNFHRKDIFDYFDAYEKRLKDIKNIINSLLDYQKLEKVEVGGLIGRWYSNKVEELFSRFSRFLEKLGTISYDPLDMFNDANNVSFMEDYNAYLEMTDDFDKRLTTICKACFEYSDDLMSLHKFIMVFGSTLLDRPIISKVVSSYYQKVLDLLDQELAEQKRIFDRQLGIVKNTSESLDYPELLYMPEETDTFYPPVARQVMWGNTLKCRLTEDLKSIRALKLPIMKTQKAAEIMLKINEMCEKTKNYLKPIFIEWKKNTPRLIQENIKKPLFIVNEDKTIGLNFAKELDSAIKVTRYLILGIYYNKDPVLYITIDDLPNEAMELYKREKNLINYKRDINDIVMWYNTLRTKTHNTEYELVQKEIEKIDFLINNAQKNINWSSEEPVQFDEEIGDEEMLEEEIPIISSIQHTIAIIHSLTENLYDRMMKIQNNYKEVVNLSNQWNNQPLYIRDKNTMLIEFDKRIIDAKTTRHKELIECSKKIKKLLKEDLLLFNNIPIIDPNAMKPIVFGEEGEEDANIVALNLEMIDNTQASSDKSEENDNQESTLEESIINNEAESLEEELEHEEMQEEEKRQISIYLNKSISNEVENELSSNEDVEEIESLENYIDTQIRLLLSDENIKQMWEEYKKYVDKAVLEGIQKSVLCSLNYIRTEINLIKGSHPMFMIIYILNSNGPKFSPSLEVISDEILFLDKINLLLGDIVELGSFIERVSNDNTPYNIEIRNIEAVKMISDEIIEKVKNTTKKALTYITQYQEYSPLWSINQQIALSLFVTYGRDLSPDEIEMIDEIDSEGNPILQSSSPKLIDYKNKIDSYDCLLQNIDKIEDSIIFNNWFMVNLQPFKINLLKLIVSWSDLFKNYLVDKVVNSLRALRDFTRETDTGLLKPLEEGDYEGLVAIMGHLFKVRERQMNYDYMFEPLQEILDLLKTYEVEMPEDVYILMQELPGKWMTTKKNALNVKSQVVPLIQTEGSIIGRRIILLGVRETIFKNNFLLGSQFKWDCKRPYIEVDKAAKNLNELEDLHEKLLSQAILFEIPQPEPNILVPTKKSLKLIKQLWDFVSVVKSWIESWQDTLWKDVDTEIMDIELKRFAKELKGMDKEIREWEVYIRIENMVKNMMTSLRALIELQNPAMKDRHWNELMEVTNVQFTIENSTTLNDLVKLNLHQCEEDVKIIVDKSVKEMSMEKSLKEFAETWNNMEFEYTPHSKTKYFLLKVREELIEILEDNQVQLQNMMSSKFVGHFYDDVLTWQKKLNTADQIINLWLEVQRIWAYLESIFIGSDDIRTQLPDDTRRFEILDRDFKNLLADIKTTPNVIKATSKLGLFEKLSNIQLELGKCEKVLTQYLETKRLAYPRFYFLSQADLLDILSNGNNPEAVCKHLTKLYDSIGQLKFGKEKVANGMFAKDGEYVEFNGQLDCSGQVEKWLNRLTDIMRSTGRYYFNKGVRSYDEKPRRLWIFDYPAQTALCGIQIWWTTETNEAFARLELGHENALKEFNKKQIIQLNELIDLLLDDLTAGDRQKVNTICTIDVHCRDVVAKMISMRTENSAAFQWQSQLRHRWDLKEADCFANICDAQFRYSYEYLGNTPRLVVTPLTDRCYITLTQSLHLIMGGAPAGPAGTGKTETTKDLGKAIGMMVYVFNCSEQMDYTSCGNIYKGLAQTGAWGCFDEFNRISIEVLSVVATQVKSVLDSIKAKRSTCILLGDTVNLVTTVGMFITMNPGYAGRAELPENLKALFRPCAMVVPDFELICEINLIAEGFQSARLLARKFITLYSLCKELLSKQDHYDWGLRAIKSLLVVAGSLKRADRLRPEDQVLMRALRDFNTPKIVTDDVPIFMGLIGDLFPALDVPRKRNLEFEKQIRQATIDLKLQPEDSFILKVIQLVELLEVRHSVFIIGNAGTGKSEVWKTLYKTYSNLNYKPYYNDIEPKAVTNDELFGVISPTTREWVDGLFSCLIREQAQMSGNGSKWMVMDGDIDPMWIESLNTVMDDNKVLTLASNERIALTRSMRLIFEISNLRSATPATVSRAGILYINPADLGWNPYVASWIDTRTSTTEKAALVVLFDKYVPVCLEALKSKFKIITPIPEITHIQMLCTLLECLLTPTNVPPETTRDIYETYFVFACIWAFGSAAFQDQLIDWRNEFTKWWTSEFKTIKLPSVGQVFNYFIDPETKQFRPWSELMISFDLDADVPLQQTLVSTSETTRIRYFLDLLIDKRKPIMLVGSAGTGKSVIVNEKLKSLPTDQYAVTNVSLNFYTTSEMLQMILEKPLEKKAGRNYGPPGGKTLIYFIDDINMPEVDLYGTVQPHTLIRQHMDYKHWYDRTKLTLKDINNVLFTSSMNPTAGSFTIDSRLQRHFYVFALGFPSHDALFTIYNSIFSQHLSNPAHKFNQSIIKLSAQVVQLAISFHEKIQTVFLPTAIKFHYIFNLRDMSNVFQGLMFATGECVTTASSMIRLWLHETSRIYGDKLVDKKDQETFTKTIIEQIKKIFNDIQDSEYLTHPLLYSHFAEAIGDQKYMPVRSWTTLQKLLTDAMNSYNELIGAMNLVLFEDAMSHVCRINRILELPRGNALLVGVGGSGKQSLARLSAFISSLEPFQVQLRASYGVNDLRADLASLYLKAGLKNIGIMFLMTDSQVADERFLVLINDMLASGQIPDLFADDEIDNIIQTIGPEVKAAGFPETKENGWIFFINKVRSLLKTVLCFSPVGSTLRVRARRFPALVNCTSINWFYEWPKEALESVSFRFLSNLDELTVKLKKPVSLFMAHVHSSVNDVSLRYLANDRRYNYTTPKSFLEQITLYMKLLVSKTNDIKYGISRFQNGIKKLISCAAQVDGLKAELDVQEVELAKKNAKAEELIKIVQKESEKVKIEKEKAAEEEYKVKLIEEDVALKQKMCAEDLEKAEPALIAAQEALNVLTKDSLSELKKFPSPSTQVINVCAAVLVLLTPDTPAKIPKDRSWKACQAMMATADGFLRALVNYNKEKMRADVVKAIQPYINDPEFDPNIIRGKSQAAAGLCAWVINIMKFYDVWQVVEPKRRARDQATEELNAARNKLTELRNMIIGLERKQKVLTDEFESAVAEKIKCQNQADETAMRIDLANRLVNGLASENVRWKESVSSLQKSLQTLPGDILIVSAFVSYVGYFTKIYRQDLMKVSWLPFFKEVKPEIPVTDHLDPLILLTDDAQIAAWNNEGLPNDRMSSENATILTNSDRWPLIVDPQSQGIKWVKNKYGKALKVTRLSFKNYLSIIENCVRDGHVLLIENIGENIDPVLDNVIGRNLIKKGRAVKIGEKEVDFSPNFKLILHTKLSNPHYKPELQAQTTLINFTVNRDQLEDQLLAEVVKVERPDLEKLRTELTKQQNGFKITLKQLEDGLLQRLSSAGGEILGDKELVLNLEKSKKTATEIEIKVVEAKTTSKNIDIAREEYRVAATRASILYFIMNDLIKINMIYQFSLEAFSVVFQRAMRHTEKANTLNERITKIIDNITYQTFIYTSRSLFERDKLIFITQVAIQIQLQAQKVKPTELDYLLRRPYIVGLTSPFDFISSNVWGAIKALVMSDDEFTGLDKDIEASGKRWQIYMESEAPEKEKLPQDWKNKTPLQRLCILRSMRTDRMTYASKAYVEEVLGVKYTNFRPPEFSESFKETTSRTPVFFILSAGVDPTRDVEAIGRKKGYTIEKRNFLNISLGQGQEKVAEDAMDLSSKMGYWVMLQNVHLVKKWLPILDKKMEASFEHPHKNFRLFISAEPAPAAMFHIIPQGVLDGSIKITNESPTGMMANLHNALDNFNQETLEMCSKEGEFKAILFSLCYFHSCVLERSKFGAQGWNRSYPFNVGDLTISVNVLYNYLEANNKVPWEDLRYLFGEIMYGGHITDDWDRRLCRNYLEVFMNPNLLEGDLAFSPGFMAPPNLDYKSYHQYIEDLLPPESPLLYGLHPNAEIGTLTTRSENLFATLMEMQPRDAGSSGGGGISRDEKVKQTLDDILDKVPEPFNISDMVARVEERTPYVVVSFQECERMNMLMNEIRRSLKELNLGLKGELTITSVMEALEECLFMDKVPPSWEKRAYPSLLSLSAWYADLLIRLRELESWVSEFQLPSSVWLGGFFNPQSFLTAIMQNTARKMEWPLDKMCLQCDVTKKFKEEISVAPREGAMISGLIMEGARWDINMGCIVDSVLKELFPIMPVIHVKAIIKDKQDLRNMYECPVYKIKLRGPTYVWTFNLKTRQKPSKWVLAGVAILLSI
ncbi:dynein beta chain, ciliary-like [Daktulosphaira vitifoliae]|uniref:dynein beta chain, ciliary-like n=1 Tax=Daktulosphaira vitifoliae TaxID=58002 RepID=UPI0021AA55B4|nr:dynein beta chain, ciliary-like [Daktulosphaira vitifoliae]